MTPNGTFATAGAQPAAHSGTRARGHLARPDAHRAVDLLGQLVCACDKVLAVASATDRHVGAACVAAVQVRDRWTGAGCSAIILDEVASAR